MWREDIETCIWMIWYIRFLVFFFFNIHLNWVIPIWKMRINSNWKNQQISFSCWLACVTHLCASSIEKNLFYLTKKKKKNQTKMYGVWHALRRNHGKRYEKKVCKTLKHMICYFLVLSNKNVPNTFLNDLFSAIRIEPLKYFIFGAKQFHSIQIQTKWRCLLTAQIFIFRISIDL